MLKCVRLGKVQWTHPAYELLNHEDVDRALRRHIAGNWGNCSPEVREENDRAARADEVDMDDVVGFHTDRNGNEFLIHTYRDRSLTTIMLPLEW